MLPRQCWYRNEWLQVTLHSTYRIVNYSIKEMKSWGQIIYSLPSLYRTPRILHTCLHSCTSSLPFRGVGPCPRRPRTVPRSGWLTRPFLDAIGQEGLSRNSLSSLSKSHNQCTCILTTAFSNHCINCSLIPFSIYSHSFSVSLSLSLSLSLFRSLSLSFSFYLCLSL